MTSTKTLIAAGLAGAALAAGCGDDDESSGISKSEYVAKANAICQRQNARFQRAFEGLSGKLGDRPPTGEQAQQFVRENLPTFRAAVEERARIEAPDGDEAEIEAINEANAKGITAIERGLTDPESAKASLQTNPTETGDKLSARYGMKQCGER